MQNIDECDVKHGDYILQILLSMLFFFIGATCALKQMWIKVKQ